MQSSLFICTRSFFKILVITLVLLHTSLLFAQKTETDSISVKNIEVKTILMESTRSKGLSGLKVSLILEYMLVLEDSLYVNYNLNGKLYTRSFSNLHHESVDRLAIFHPYAILYETSGKQQAEFSLNKIKGAFKKNSYKISGVKTHRVSVEVPILHSIQIKVNYTEVTPKTPKGKDWDFHLFPRGDYDKYPDLIFTIEAPFNEDSRGIFSGQFYRAHKQKNTLLASWPYFSDNISYCEGDELSLCIKDADLIFHDNIGCISIYKLLETKQAEQLQFGSVLKFSCELEAK